MKKIVTALFASLLACTSAVAQYTSQTFPLESGWNSIYLEVDPVDSNASAVFGLPVIGAVWSLADQPLFEAAARCDDLTNPSDPNCQPFDSTHWRVWVPGNEAVTTLRVIRGGTAYLVRATGSASLVVVGKPNPKTTTWVSGMNNFVGFHVDPAGPPTIATYLAPSPIHAGAVVFRVQPNGSLASVPLTQAIEPGRAYYVRASAAGAYDGPVSVDDMTLRGLNFALTLVDHSMTVENRANAARTISVSLIASLPAPAGAVPAKIGDVPLDWLELRSTDNGEDQRPYEWRQFGSGSSAPLALAATGAPSARRSLRISVDRARISTVTGPNESYQGILSVTDGVGFRRLVPVSAQLGSRAGLWVGSVTVNAVSWVTSGAPEVIVDEDDIDDSIVNNTVATDRTLPLPTQHEFTFPIILHWGGTDAAPVHKMLMEVTMLWRNGDSATGTPGGPVLATPECTDCDQYQGGTLVNGQPAARRISSAAYVFARCARTGEVYTCQRDPQGRYLDVDLELSGSFGTQLTGEAFLPFDHPLNPFRHPFHPDHDALTKTCKETGALPNPSESYDLTRKFTFTFDGQRPPDIVGSGWGHVLMAGTYREELRGLTARDSETDGAIVATGRFEIRRVSDVAVLNGQ